MNYPHLFSPRKIGNLEIANRIIMAPMATNFAGESGGATQRLVDYYRERARGGPGLIIVENSNIDYPQGKNGATQLRIDNDSFLPGLAGLAEVIHEAGREVKAAIQLNHGGAATRSTKTEGRQPVGPSAIPVSPAGEVPRPLTEEEIEAIAKKFAQAALRAKRAGFDAVEIHGGYAYLLAEFISPLTNQRTDNYGGSLENRMRFPIKAIKYVRELVGPDFPLLFRINGDEFMSGALTFADAAAGAKMLEKAGVDLLHVTAGNGHTVERHIEPASFPEGWKSYLATGIKAAVGIPVATVGVIRHPATAEALISSGCADFVAIGRGMIADPYWVEKAQSGRISSIRRCISCNVCASRRVFEDLPVRCTVNPMVGHEGEAGVILPRLPAGQKVAVVGGGPAGMYAALLLSERGHAVTLFEAKEKLGGQVRLAATLPYKDKLFWLLEFLEHELVSKGIDVRIGVEASPEILAALEPEAVVLATGAKPLLPVVSGIDSPKVTTVNELLAGPSYLKDAEVTVIGGGLVGCECAELLAGCNKVTVIDMLPEVALDLDPISRADLLRRLAKAGVTILTGCRLRSIEEGVCTCEVSGLDGLITRSSVPADLIVLAVGNEPENELAKMLSMFGKKIYMIGDCVKPGRIGDALRQAALVVTAMERDAYRM